MSAAKIGKLDSIISCYAYENAIAALGLLQSSNPGSLPPEMLATLDNFIQLALFSEHIWVHSHWVELHQIEEGLKANFLPEPSFGGPGKEEHEYFKTQQLFEMLPRVESEQALEKFTQNLQPLNPSEWPICQIRMDIPSTSTSFFQEMIVWDLLLLEEAFEEYGLNRFKPVFPGEQIYLGLRGIGHSEQSISDLVARKLRDGMRVKIRKLNDQQKKLGALSIPENPPLFLLRLLSENPKRKNLARELIKLRESRPFKLFRKSATECQEMLSSSDLEVRSRAGRLITSIEGIELDESKDYVALTNKGFDVFKAISSGLAGSILEPLKQVFELSNDLLKVFSERPLAAMKEFSNTKINSKALDEFVKREFGDQMHASEMQTISYLLGLPDSYNDWEKLDTSFSVSHSPGHSGLNGRHLMIKAENLHITSLDMKKMLSDMFGRFFNT